MARLFFEAGNIVLCSFVSPFEQGNFVRKLLPAGRFLEISVDTPLDVCKERDTKGLYQKAERGEIAELTGISSPYEPPNASELVIRTPIMTVNEAVEQVVRKIRLLELTDGAALRF